MDISDPLVINVFVKTTVTTEVYVTSIQEFVLVKKVLKEMIALSDQSFLAQTTAQIMESVISPLEHVLVIKILPVLIAPLKSNNVPTIAQAMVFAIS